MSDKESGGTTAEGDRGNEGKEAGTSSTKSKVLGTILISSKQHERWMALRKSGDFKTDLTLMDYALRLLEYVQRDKREMVLLPITTIKSTLQQPKNYDPVARIHFPETAKMPFTIDPIGLPDTCLGALVGLTNMLYAQNMENSGNRIHMGKPLGFDVSRRGEGPPKKRLKYGSLDEKSSAGLHEYLASVSASASPENYPGRPIRVESISSTDSEDSLNLTRERGLVEIPQSHANIPLIKIDPPDSYETYSSAQEESGADGKDGGEKDNVGTLQEGGASMKVAIGSVEENVITLIPVDDDENVEISTLERVSESGEGISSPQTKRSSDSVSGDSSKGGEVKRIKLVHTRGIWCPEIHSPSASPTANRRSSEFKFPLPRGDSHGEGTPASGDNGGVLSESYAQFQSARYSYSCNLCSTCFMSEGEVRQHLSGEHNIYRYICRICGISNDDEMTLYEHGTESHPNIYCCGMEGCKYFSVRLSSVKAHFNAQHNQHVLKKLIPTEVLWNEGTNADKYLDQQVAYISTTLENMQRQVQRAIARAKSSDTIPSKGIFVSPTTSKRAKSLDTYSKLSLELSPESPLSPKRRRTVGKCGSSHSSSGDFPDVESCHYSQLPQFQSKDGLESPTMGVISGWNVSSSPCTPLSQASSSETGDFCLDPGPGSSEPSERSDFDSLDTLGVDVSEEVSATELARREQEMERATKMFRKFLSESGTSVEFEKVPNSEINNSLKLFISNIRTRAGKYFKSSTLREIYIGISRHLQKAGIDILTEPDFESSRQVFKAAMSDIKSCKVTEMHTPQLSQDDIFQLYSPSHGTFDINTPMGLQNKVWFEIKLHLDRRKPHDFSTITRDMFSIQKDPNDREYVTLAGEGRMYDMPGSQLCPVVSFKKYINKLNPDATCFWQRPKSEWQEGDAAWYCNPPLDQVSLSTKMADISRQAELSQVYSNHSVRVTSLSLLSRTYHGTPSTESATSVKTQEN